MTSARFGYERTPTPYVVLDGESLPLPPFLDVRLDQPRLVGVNVDVYWHVADVPTVVPEIWVQAFRDGIECATAPLVRTANVLRFTATYDAFVALVCGCEPIEEFGNSVGVDGPLGALSAWSALVQDDMAPRKRRYTAAHVQSICEWARIERDRSSDSREGIDRLR